MKVSPNVFPRYWSALAVACGLLALSPSALGTVTVNVNAGDLFQADGTTKLTPAPTKTSTAGSLLLLVAVGNGGTGFNNTLTAGNYVAGSDVVLASGAFNTFGGGQSTTTAFNFAIPSTASAGQPVELLWFPTILDSNYPGPTGTPASGTMFGAYSPPTGTTPDGGSLWTIPGDGTVATLDFATISAGGKEANSAGDASLTVAPEPSTATMLGGGLMGLAVWWSRKRHAKTA